MKNKRTVDIIVCGFALFAIFFGAGNLIFPPHLGVIGGKSWAAAMFGFLMSDPVLPILGVIVTARVGGKADDLGKRVSHKFSKLLGAVAILTIGPFFAVPRTGATTHEIATSQLVQGAPQAATSVVFFGLTILLALNPSGVIDKIGKFLTPALLVILTVIIITCIIKPIGPIVETEPQKFFMMGFTEGYQTMDALGSPLMAGIVITDLVRRGYTDEEDQFKVAVGVGIVAFVLLAFVYGGLTYVGATAGSFYNADTPRVELLIGTIFHLLGEPGKIIMGIAVALACLTTSVGLTATCGNFFEGITNGKLKYKHIVIVSAIISFFLSLKGVDGLIALAVPILSAIYPVIIALIVMTIFDKQIKYNLTYTGAVIGAFIIGLINAINLAFVIPGNKAPATIASLAEKITHLPFAKVGFDWLVPAIICSVVLTIIAAAGKVGKTRDDYIA